MTLNQTLISETTLNSTVASVTIPVPSGFTDIKLLMSARTTGSGTANNIGVYLNGSSSSYTGRYTGGQGNYAAVSSSLTGGDGPLTIWTANFGGDSTANTFANSEIYIPNYTASVNKTFHTESVVENNSADGRVCLTTTTWANTAAVTSIVLTPQTGSFLANSTFTLYGITKLGVTPTVLPKATGGDIVKNDGTYWYHAFLSTGAFIPSQALTADVLVVAGGGGSHPEGSGGGGAGGLLGFTNQTLTSGTSYPCTVGAGGGVGSNGNNSQFSSLTTTIGGGKGGYGQGANGGSGGGGSGTNSYGLGTAGQGYNGSDNSGNSYNGWPRGAGGGAGGPGGAVTSNNKGGDGGIGSSAYSSWGLATSTGHNVSGTVYYAGGGGGSTYSGGSGVSGSVGGYGGGGNGGIGGAGASGLPNTGGGAGGNDTTNTSVAQGGSGIIIIKYPMA